MHRTILASLLSLGLALPAPSILHAAPTTAPGEAQFAAGAFDQALPLLRTAVSSAPRDARSLDRLGRLELYADRLSDARAHFESALRIDPADDLATRELREIQSRSGADGSYRIDRGSHAVTLPFVATDPLPVIRVRLNGERDACFVIDTGAPGVVLDPETAKALHLQVESAGQGVFAGGRQAPILRSRLDAISLGGVDVHQVPVSVMPTQGAPAPAGIHVDGILGTSVLYRFLATLDYAHGRLVLAPRSGSARFERAAARRGDSIVPMWYVPDHFLFARARVNGTDGLFNIDTGGAGIGVTVSKDMLAQAHIRLDEAHRSLMRGGGGDVETLPFTANVSIGDSTVRDVPGLYMPAADQYKIFPFAVSGSISHAYFRARSVTFDFGAMRMVVGNETKGPE